MTLVHSTIDLPEYLETTTLVEIGTMCGSLDFSRPNGPISEPLAFLPFKCVLLDHWLQDGEDLGFGDLFSEWLV